MGSCIRRLPFHPKEGVGPKSTTLASEMGRGSKGVDPVLDGDSKLIAIDEEADHQIVHRRRFGKANSTTHKTLDPCPQIDVFALDFLCMLLANLMLLSVEVPLVGAPPIGVKSSDTKRV